MSNGLLSYYNPLSFVNAFLESEEKEKGEDGDCQKNPQPRKRLLGLSSVLRISHAVNQKFAAVAGTRAVDVIPLDAAGTTIATAV